MQKISLLVLTLIPFSAYSADLSDITKIINNIQYAMTAFQEGGTFITHLGTVVPMGSSFWRNRAVIHKKIETFSVDAEGREKKHVAYQFSHEQRWRAQPRYEGAMLGLMVQIIADPALNILSLPPKQLAVCSLRSTPTLFTALEQALLPSGCYVESKKILDYIVPQMHAIGRIGFSIVGAYAGTQFFIASGASPERLALAAYMYHFTADQANAHLHQKIVGRVTDSIASATRIMPIIQAIGSTIDKRPHFLTLHPTKDLHTNEVDRQQEMIYAAVPVLVHTGMDLGIEWALDLVGSTKMGVAIDQRVKAQLHPLLGEKGTETAQHLTKETVKIGATILILGCVKQAGGCTIM